ncbi:mannose receptor c type 1 [Plakobranchus ocellatus]|uniref:Mannose receptor c type 1 n=1 Tax=Plakobranchus ocellatus TaxID=259542 RepID=A0AAV4BCN2_9GAST|nr:mannose receptor c type 1 [Plakobranchus ocellatus]
MKTQASASCTPGWKDTPSGEVCIKIFNNSKKNWFDARRACQNAGGDLIIIRDETMNDFIKDHVVSNDVCAWTGLQSIHGEDKWYWLDENKTPNYTYWSIIPTLSKQSRMIFPNSEHCSCVAKSEVLTEGWHNWPCTIPMSYICEKPTGLSCSPGWTKTPSGEACIKIYDNPKKTWYDARQACLDALGDLLTLPDDTMSNFIKHLLGDNKSLTWIGSHKTLVEHRWLWYDVDKVLTYKDLFISVDECKHPARKISIGQGGYGSVCSKALRYICEKSLASPCQQGWVKTSSGEACVKAFGERAPWLRAREMCQKLGGDLVTIRGNSMSNFIRDLIVGKDSFPSWIGFHKLTGEDRWQWLDKDRMTAITKVKFIQKVRSSHCVEYGASLIFASRVHGYPEVINVCGKGFV